MSVVVLSEGPITVDVLDEGQAAATALETELVVVSIATPESFSAESLVAALAGTLPDLAPDLVLVADNAHTRAFFPALAARLRKPLLSGATRVRVRAKNRLEVERPLHAGLQSERLVVATPLFVTLATSSATPARSLGGAKEAKVAAGAPGRDRVERIMPPDAETVDIRSADRIVAGGLGLGSKENVAILSRLAKPLEAAVGGTRVISDKGWIDHERYIGSTGKNVAPKLYVALGISGASQHLVGITESENIIAINSDRAAPIFGVADLGIVGDLHAIVPELESRLAKEKE